MDSAKGKFLAIQGICEMREILEKGEMAAVFLAFDRPEHFKKAIEKARSSFGFAQLQKYLIIQGSNPEILNYVQNHLKDFFIMQVQHPADKSVKSKINYNTRIGLAKAFEDKNIKVVTVIEDDILVAKTFFLFIEKVFLDFQEDSGFRGVNGFSGKEQFMSEVPPGHTEITKSNFGLGWGWAISRKAFAHLAPYWSGMEDEHWDSLVEPYVRTGFVINPIKSQVLNIGLDGSGQHSGNNVELTEKMHSSFDSREARDFRLFEVREPLGWRKDCFSISAMGEKKAHLLYALWRIVWFSWKWEVKSRSSKVEFCYQVAHRWRTFCLRLARKIQSLWVTH